MINSEAYLYTVEVKNMSSRDLIVGNNPKERFIYFDLVIWKDKRETKRSDRLFEVRAKPIGPS